MRDAPIWIVMLCLGFVLGVTVMGLAMHKSPERSYQAINHTVEFDDLVYFNSAVILCDPHGCYSLWDLLRNRIPDRNFVEVR